MQRETEWSIWSQTPFYENRVDCFSAMIRHLKWKDLNKVYSVVVLVVTAVLWETWEGEQGKEPTKTVVLENMSTLKCHSLCNTTEILSQPQN